MAEASYVVGRGKPPLHTRFQKGQSGNPSGKPGPAKLAKERFACALLKALDGDPGDTQGSAPETGIARMANRLVQDAIGGRTAAQRLVLSLLDKAHAEQVEAELPSLDELLWPDPENRPGCVSPPVDERNESGPLSLQQGKKQGKNFHSEKTPAAAHPVRSGFEAPRFATNKPDPLSLLQGKQQGKEKYPAVRAQLLGGASAVRSANSCRLATPPPR